MLFSEYFKVYYFGGGAKTDNIHMMILKVNYFFWCDVFLRTTNGNVMICDWHCSARCDDGCRGRGSDVSEVRQKHVRLKATLKNAMD